MRTLILLLLAMLIAIAQSQIPSFGACPDHQAVKNFEREKFLGTWYELERYFTVSEVGTKCITATYERRPDGKIYINNAYTNRFTGVQRIITGQMSYTGKTENLGLFNVRYSGIPVAYDTTLKVLDTDYETFAVIWSCSSVGPFGHTESVWVMGRERRPGGNVLQKIYGVLDKFRINRTFFVETEQKDCETLPPPVEAIDPTPAPTKTTTNKKKKVSEKVKLEIIPKPQAETILETAAVENTDNVVSVNALKAGAVEAVEEIAAPSPELKSQPIEEQSLPTRIIETGAESDIAKIEAFLPSIKFVKPSDEDTIKETASPVLALKSGVDREAIAEAVVTKESAVKDILEEPVKQTVETVQSTVSVETKRPAVTKKLISMRRVGEKTENIQHIPVTIVSS